MQYQSSCQKTFRRTREYSNQSASETVKKQVQRVVTKTIMRGSRKFCQRGSNPDNVFILSMRGKRIEIAQQGGHHRPASETPFKWHFAGGLMMAGSTLNAGFVAL